MGRNFDNFAAKPFGKFMGFEQWHYPELFGVITQSVEPATELVRCVIVRSFFIRLVHFLEDMRPNRIRSI